MRNKVREERGASKKCTVKFGNRPSGPPNLAINRASCMVRLFTGLLALGARAPEPAPKLFPCVAPEPALKAAPEPALKAAPSCSATTSRLGAEKDDQVKRQNGAQQRTIHADARS